MRNLPSHPATILLVDDDADARTLLTRYLTRCGYQVRTARDGIEALDEVARESPDLLLLDILMPRLDGMGVIQALKGRAETRLIPIVALTSLGDLKTRIRALELGADDLLVKPPEFTVLKARLGNLVKLKSYTDELENAETVLCALAEGVEAKDPYTGRHCKRLSTYGTMLGKALDVPAEDLQALDRAGILHDLGKIGIPEPILMKPGPLTPEEWVIMKRHPEIGERLCKPMKTLRRVLPIIRHHHEHWNGKGYPDGLAEEAIPFTARILQVVDAYDALRTRRPYKPPLSKEVSLRILREETASGHWDPRVMEVFLDVMSPAVPLEESYAEDYAKVAIPP